MENQAVFNKIIVLVPFRNVENYIIDCLNSVVNQKYHNYEVYLLDDASNDNTIPLIKDILEGFKLISNKVRIGATENIYNALINIPLNDEDIIVRLDGDDYLLGEYVFHIINNTYNEHNALITYGQEIINIGLLNSNYLNPYTLEEFQNLRQVTWKMPPLRTFKYKLFKELINQDPEVNCLKFNKKNKFYIYTSDLALMVPLMEIAGFNRIVMITNILYCYRHHDKNDHSTDQGRFKQLEAENDIRQKKPFNFKDFD